MKEKILLYKVMTQQDADAYGALYDLYVEKIYRFVFFKLNNKEEAEDVTSEVFLRAWNYLVADQRETVKSFSGLVYQIARNAVVDAYRSRAKKQSVPIEQAHTLEVTTDVGEKIDLDQAVVLMLEQIKQLKQEYQEVITLRYIEELSLQEIAKATGKNSASVRVTLHRAIKKLKALQDKKPNQEK